ncbi:unnamed protein product [Ectocarpus sp. 13 AM-2016]
MASISSIVGGTSFSFTTRGLTLPDGGEAARGELACQARARKGRVAGRSGVPEPARVCAPRVCDCADKMGKSEEDPEK